MFTKKSLGVQIVIFVGMILLRAEPTGAFQLSQTPAGTINFQESSKIELEANDSNIEVTPLGHRIGYNFIIRNDIGLVEEHPAVAYSSQRQEYLVVWYNDRPGNDDIRGQRVSKNGTLVGGPFYISAGAGADRRYPEVAYNSKNDQYLVVWEHNDGLWNSIRARRVSGPGVVIDNTDIVITSGSNIITPARPAVEYAYTSDKYLVVWEETFHPIPIQRDIVGRVVSSSGTPEGSQFVISKDPGNVPRESPDLAYNRKRNEYLVVWQQYHSASIDKIIGRRVTGGGTPLNPAEIVIFYTSFTSTNPSVAALPNVTVEGQYLVAFEVLTDPGNNDIFSIFVSGDGSLGDGRSLGSSTENDTDPVIASSEASNQYLVAWSRPTSPLIVYDYIAGRSVSSTGVRGEEMYIAGFPLADHAAVASGPMGDFLVAFQDQQPPSVDSGIYGQLWGNRTYLPIMLRNH